MKQTPGLDKPPLSLKKRRKKLTWVRAVTPQHSTQPWTWPPPRTSSLSTTSAFISPSVWGRRTVSGMTRTLRAMFVIEVLPLRYTWSLTWSSTGTGSAPSVRGSSTPAVSWSTTRWGRPQLGVVLLVRIVKIIGVSRTLDRWVRDGRQRGLGGVPAGWNYQSQHNRARDCIWSKCW